MRFALMPMWIGAALAMPAHAAQPVADSSQLTQLNRASEQELRNVQRLSGYPGPVQSPAQILHRQRLDRQQAGAQQQLQERQRRELLLLNQRARTAANPAWQQHLDAINRQRQFRLQQQQQLNWFRGQRGLQIR